MHLPFPELEDDPSVVGAFVSPTPPDGLDEKKLNYFNYFTEVEEAFVARRGAPMMISPLDWSLVESWKSTGVPMHVALRGIMKAFDQRDARPKKPNMAFKKVNTLFYCQQAVMTEFAQYCESQVGASTQADADGEGDPQSASANPMFSASSVRRFLTDVSEELERAENLAEHRSTPEHPHARWREALQRTRDQLREILETVPETPDGQAPALNLESLEQDLTRLEELLYQALCADLPPETAESVDAETSAALKPHRKRMEADVYRQTFENYRARQLRLMYAVPRLSLFYLCPE